MASTCIVSKMGTKTFRLRRKIMAQKWEAQGGRGGTQWDDGNDFENVKKVYVGQDESGVAYVKFEYEKDGKIESFEHGKMTLLGTDEYEIDPEDYITCVKIYYEKLLGLPSEIITSLEFKTFKGKTSTQFGLASGVEVDLGAELGGGKIVGFHGTSSSDVIHSLGAYILPSSTPLTPSPNTVPAQGGDGGGIWDDRVHDGVSKIYIGRGESCVTYFKVDYFKLDKQKKPNPKIGSDHGKIPSHEAEGFVLDTDEYITKVSGYYGELPRADGDKIDNSKDAPVVIISLKFITNKKTSVSYGPEAGTEFVLEKEGHKIVGFHGQADQDYLHKLGVYVAPIATDAEPIIATDAKPI